MTGISTAAISRVSTSTHLGIAGLDNMLSHAFIRHALFAGTAIGLLCGLVGYFVALRGQVFAGDALSHVAYTGALAALVVGVDLRAGLYLATIVASVVLGALRGRRAPDDVVIGTTFTWILGLGVLFLAIYTKQSSRGDSTANVHILFGSIFGISANTATTTAAVSAVVVVVLVAVARPLLFASLDPAVAAARGIPVGVLSIGFLALVGIIAAQATQAVGALLLLGLLAGPAAAAQLVTNRPWRTFGLAGAFAVTAIWAGITIAYTASRLPPSFAIMTVVVVQFAAARVFRAWRTRRDRIPSS